MPAKSEDLTHGAFVHITKEGFKPRIGNIRSIISQISDGHSRIAVAQVELRQWKRKTLPYYASGANKSDLRLADKRAKTLPCGHFAIGSICMFKPTSASASLRYEPYTQGAPAWNFGRQDVEIVAPLWDTRHLCSCGTLWSPNEFRICYKRKTSVLSSTLESYDLYSPNRTHPSRTFSSPHLTRIRSSQASEDELWKSWFQDRNQRRLLPPDNVVGPPHLENGWPMFPMECFAPKHTHVDDRLPKPSIAKKELPVVFERLPSSSAERNKPALRTKPSHESLRSNHSHHRSRTTSDARTSRNRFENPSQSIIVQEQINENVHRERKNSARKLSRRISKSKSKEPPRAQTPVSGNESAGSSQSQHSKRSIINRHRREVLADVRKEEFESQTPLDPHYAQEMRLAQNFSLQKPVTAPPVVESKKTRHHRVSHSATEAPSMNIVTVERNETITSSTSKASHLASHGSLLGPRHTTVWTRRYPPVRTMVGTHPELAKLTEVHPALTREREAVDPRARGQRLKKKRSVHFD